LAICCRAILQRVAGRGPIPLIEPDAMDPSTPAPEHDAPTVDGERQEPAPGEALAQISTGLVQLHRRYYGKGPTKAKTHQVNDTVISILRGGFTTVERTLIDEGSAEPVHAMRRSFQAVMEDQFTAIVEEATGRKVVAYMSQVHENPDLAVEIFLLEPAVEAMSSAAGSTEETRKSAKVAPRVPGQEGSLQCLRSVRTPRRRSAASSEPRAFRRAPGCGSPAK
jgi:uncharacterized protein YbcI